MKHIIGYLFLLSSFLSCDKALEIEDIVVIGGGLMGSSTAWELSQESAKVLLVERQDSIYTFGSSFGEARISRSLGPEKDIFSYLQQRSVAEIEELIAFLNEGTDDQMHSMEEIFRTSPVTYIRYKSQAEEVDRLLSNQKDSFKFASDQDQALRIFDMDIPDTAMIIREYKQYSGTLNPQVLISKLHLGIQKAGNRISYNEKVVSLKRKDDLYEIKLENGKTKEIKTLLSRQVIAAAGPYNGVLVKEVAPYFDELISPKRLFLSFLKINPAVFTSLSAEEQRKIMSFYPVAEIDHEIYYSMIEKFDEDNIPIIKVGGHFLRTDIDHLDEVWEKSLTEDEIQWSKMKTLKYLQMLRLPILMEDLELVSGYSCVYSLTATEVPYVTNVIKENGDLDSNFVLVGGMSGIGAKGSLTYGKIASNLLLGKTENDELYQNTVKALGVSRLRNDLNLLEE